jgi:hypothetical protein
MMSRRLRIGLGGVGRRGEVVQGVEDDMAVYVRYLLYTVHKTTKALVRTKFYMSRSQACNLLP